MTDFSQQEQPDSVHLTAPVPSEVFTTRESLRERCDMFVRCLPQAPMRDMLARLFEDLLAGQHVWISVEERMPEAGTDCLVWHREYAPGRGTFAKVDRWDEQHEAPVGWSSATVPIGLGWDDSDLDDVTHWMPLPDAPHHRSSVGAPGSNKTESESESDFAALRAVPHQPTGERK